MEGFLRFLLILIMAIEVIAIVRYERKKFSSYVSPGILLSVPLFIVILTAYLLGGALGYIKIALNTLFIFVTCIPYFVVIGNLFATRKKCFVSPNNKMLSDDSNVSNNSGANKNDLNRKIAKSTAFFTCILILLLGLNIFVLNRELLGLLGTDKFGEVLSAGIPAHLFVASILCAIIILATFSKREWYTLIPFCIIILYTMLLGVKYNLIIILLGGLILRIFNGKMKLKFVYCAITAVVLFVLCICVYLLEFSLKGLTITSESFVEVFRHLLKYLFSGTLAMGEIVEKAAPSANLLLLFRPVITILNFLTFGIFSFSQPVLTGSGIEWIFVGINNTMPVNVSSFFGDIYMFNGVLGLVIVQPILAMLIYSAYNIGQKRNNIWLKAAYVVIATPLALSWFGYYYNLLTFYELYFFCIVIYGFSRIRENSRLEVMQQKNIKEQENARKIKR